MLAIDQLFKSGEVTPITVWLDGMISEATAIHASHPDYLNRDLRKQVLREVKKTRLILLGSSRWIQRTEGINPERPIPCIVLATSGI